MEKRRYQMKEGVGPHFIGPKEYGPGDVMEMHPYQVENIMDKLIPLDPEPPEEQPEQKDRLVIYENAVREYNIVNPKDDSHYVNNEPLSLDEAREIAGPDAEIIPFGTSTGHDPDIPQVSKEHRGGGRWLIIYDETGQPVSETYYKKAQASRIMKAVNSGKMNIEDVE